MDLQRLANELNECFGEPFLPKGFVRAEVMKNGTLWLDIGDRNGDFDIEGNRISSGSNVGDAVEYEIKRRNGAKNSSHNRLR